MITKNHRQEGLSRAYIQAVAAKAGFAFNPRTVDYGMDFSLNQIVLQKGRLCETGIDIDIQARSTTLARITAEAVLYDLDIHTYEMLRDPLAKTMRLLVLLVLPTDESEWLRLSEEELLLRRAAYWYSVKGQPSTTNRRSIRLAIPRSQLFTPEALHDLARRKT